MKTSLSRVISAAALIFGCVASAHGAPDEDALTLDACRLESPRGLGSVAARCGVLEVAENPAEPDGAKIGLFVAVVPALGESEENVALAVLSGGPGQAATDFYTSYAPAFGRVNRHQDILLVDQRGTGKSNRLDCFEMEVLETGDPSLEQLREATTKCLEEIPGDPRYYTTSIAVRDLDRVREVLGYARLDLYGVSYGTRVAQHYLRRFEEKTRAVVLDGVAPADLSLGPGIAIDAQAALDSVFARCTASPVCTEQFPDLEEGFEVLRLRLEIDPQHVDINDPLTGELRTIRFSHLELGSAVRLLSYNQDTVALLPLLLDQAQSHDNLKPLAAQAAMIMGDLTSQISYGMHNAVVCTEDVPFYKNVSIDRAALARTYLGTFQLEALEEICALWPQGDIDADFKTPVESNRPVFLLSGSVDPVTPAENGDRVAAHLTNAVHLVLQGQGHGQLALGCVPKLVDTFLTNPDPQGLDTSCVEPLEPSPFFTSFVGPEP